MLLCDKCNRGHHAYCLKPPLEVSNGIVIFAICFSKLRSQFTVCVLFVLQDIPRGDWFCGDCRSPEPLPTPSKRRNALTDEDILNELESEDEVEGDRGTIQMKSKKMSALQQDEDLEVCAECGFGGEVICCDSCPLVYHLLCLNPPKTRVPRGIWHCGQCTNPSGKRKRDGRMQASNQRRRAKSVKALAFESSSEGSEVDSETEKTPSEDARSITPNEDRNGKRSTYFFEIMFCNS